MAWGQTAIPGGISQAYQVAAITIFRDGSGHAPAFKILNPGHEAKAPSLAGRIAVIEAKNVDNAKQIFLDKANEKFNDDELFASLKGEDSVTNVTTKVENCEFIDIVDETRMSASTPSTMFLKLASAINYTFTTEERKFLKNKGTCV